MSKPIDAIRDQISSDLIKNKNFVLCEIEDAKWKYIGLVIKVKPMRSSVLHAEETSEGMELREASFSALCINKSWFDKFFVKKYYALVFNIVKDMPDGAIAIAIPKSFVDIFDKKNANIEDKEAIKKENVTED